MIKGTRRLKRAVGAGVVGISLTLALTLSDRSNPIQLLATIGSGVDVAPQDGNVETLSSETKSTTAALIRRQATRETPARAGRPPLKTVKLTTGSRTLEVVDHEVLVQLKPGTSRGMADQLASSLGSRVLQQGRHSGVYRLQVPTGMNLAQFTSLLRRSDHVEGAYPNAVTEATSLSGASLQYRPYQWNLDRLDFNSAWATPANLAGVTVAVLDTGVAYETAPGFVASSDLSSSPLTPGYDFVNNDSHPNDDHQHGTHIANTIAAYGGTLGVAPGVGIMPVKVLGADRRGSELDLAEGIYYAVDHGADIINMSLSFSLGYFPTPILEEAIEYAATNNVVMVASVGNGGTYGTAFPAAFPDVIAVGSVRMSKVGSTLIADSIAKYSNYGAGMDIMAPGGDLGFDINRDRVPDGVLAQTAHPTNPAQMGYWLISGTSQATAHVSGAAAWLISAGIPASQVTKYLLNSATDLAFTGYDYLTGAGMLQVQAARNLAAGGVAPSEPYYYVNGIPRLIRNSQGTRAIIRIEVLDQNGRRASNVKVRGAWFGSVSNQMALATTNSEGLASFSSPYYIPTGKVAIGFQVAAVIPPTGKVHGRTFQYYSLSPAYAEVYSRLLTDSTNGRAQLIYKLDPADSSLDFLFSRSQMIPSYVYKPVGVGLRSGPLTIVVNEDFIPELLQASSSEKVAVSWSFASPLDSGFGMISSVEGLRIDKAVPRLGSAPRYLILKLDPGMGKLVIGRFYPVVNAYATDFLSHNETFGNGFASSALADGFASSALGDGFASSSLGDGFASSSLGDGFASSSLGDGFASSSLGDGFASSSLGDGFASSAMAAGFVSSSLGDGFLSSALGDSQMATVAAQAGDEGSGDVVSVNVDDAPPAGLIESDTETTLPQPPPTPIPDP